MLGPPSCPRLARGTLYKSVYILLSLCRGLGELPLLPPIFKLLPPPPVSSSPAACYSINSRRPSNPDPSLADLGFSFPALGLRVSQELGT